MLNTHVGLLESIPPKMTDELMQRLEAHSNYFSSMLALIPDKFKHENDEQRTDGSKFHRNKREKRPKQAIKEASKRAKRLKLDPEYMEVDKQATVESQPELPHVLQQFSVEGKHCESVNDLREKLRAKIEALQSRREVVRQHGKKQKTSVKKKDKKQTKSIATTKQTTTKKPSIVREDGKIVFSKFDFTTPSEPSDKVDENKKVNYKKLLAKAEAKEQSLKVLKEKDAERTRQLEERLNWKRAMGKARGDKVKDDPSLLKKTLKRKEQQKRSSKKKWGTRKAQELKRMEQKQEKRQRHIKERQEAKKAKKMGNKPRKPKVKKIRKPGF